MPPDPVHRRAAAGRPWPASLALEVTLVASLAIVFFLVAAPVLAHAELVESTPADGAAVPPPAEVVAVFSEALVADRSSLEVRDAAGAVVARGGLDPADPKRLTMRAELPALEPGTYTVRWTAVAEDGHVERGTFGFQVVEAPSPSPSSSLSPPSSPPPSPSLPPPSPSPTAAPPVEPSPSPTAEGSPSTAPRPTPSSEPPASPGGSGGDTLAVVLPIVVGLGVVAVAAGWLVRRRSA
ncbi:MAG: hypothetical protein KatS3mg065_0756 [Chloroflexota bacterium]|nr:MAG: hypothetical protein KatS3mg065_0756 [Chloroflexota bacterium]